ncbi:MAG: peptidoglycan DD-metalloendopeptidase family protein [Clostridium sp.]
MDKNYKQRAKRFFKKEGFYIVLFLCICITATVATISFKKSNDLKETSKIENIEDKETINSEEEKIKKEDIALENEATEMQNAERAENVTEPSNEAKAVSTPTEVIFSKPVNGKLLRGYTYPKPVKFNETTQRTIRGIDIESKIGTEVKAAAEGLVEKAENTGVEDGIVVVIKHANGIKTKYCNLAEGLSVKTGDKVKEGTVIGKIGESAKLFSKDNFGEHLNLQVLNSENEQMDPLKYFSYKTN